MSYDSTSSHVAGRLDPWGGTLSYTLDWLALRATDQGNLGLLPSRGTRFTAFCMVLLLLEWMWQDAAPLWD